MAFTRTTRLAVAGGVLAATLGAGVIGLANARQTPDGLPQGSEPVTLNPADFTTRIDNPYWPMKPGTRWIYRETESGGGTSRRIVVKVTRRTRKIANGITARVITDVVTERERPVEKTRDWYAQDSAGNLWYLGEDTTSYRKGKPVSSEGSWEAGVDGAQAGVIMPAAPQSAMTYRQEYYKGHAEDNGEIISVDEQAGVPAGHFDNVVMTKDTNALEPRSVEFKFYARGVGPVLEVVVSGGSDRAELVRHRPAR